jgi:hypothetical protein
MIQPKKPSEWQFALRGRPTPSPLSFPAAVAAAGAQAPMFSSGPTTYMTGPAKRRAGFFVLDQYGRNDL